MTIYCEWAVITDAHLHAPTFNEEAFCDTLSDLQIDDGGALIFGGDVIDRHKYRKLPLGRAGEHIRDKKCRKKLVTGNHDPEWEHPPANYFEWERSVVELRPFAAAINAELCPEFAFRWQRKDCLVIHGHQFDTVLDRPLLSQGLSAFYELCQPLAKRQPRLKRVVKCIAHRCSRHFREIRDGAHALARERNLDYLVFGHDHRMLYRNCGPYTLINPGCFKDDDMGVAVFGDEAALVVV